MWFWTNYFRTLSPVGLVAAGAVAGVVGVPVLKKTLRGLAVLTIKGAMAAGDAVRKAGGSVGRSWEEMVEEVKANRVNTDDGSFAYLADNEIVPEEMVANKSEQKLALNSGGGNGAQMTPGNEGGE